MLMINKLQKPVGFLNFMFCLNYKVGLSLPWDNAILFSQIRKFCNPLCLQLCKALILSKQ